MNVAGLDFDEENRELRTTFLIKVFVPPLFYLKSTNNDDFDLVLKGEGGAHRLETRQINTRTAIKKKLERETPESQILEIWWRREREVGAVRTTGRTLTGVNKKRAIEREIVLAELWEEAQACRFGLYLTNPAHRDCRIEQKKGT